MESKQLLVQDDVPMDTGKTSRFWKYLNFRRRYVVAFLSFLGFVNVYTLRVSLSVSVISMEEQFEDYKAKKGLVLAAFFYGYIFTQIPGGWIASRYGGKKLFGISVIVTSALCIITPFVAKDYRILVGLRVLQGLAEGSTYPAAHAVWSRWAPASERSRLATISFSGSYIGTVLSLSMSGYITEKFGWPYIFYCFGTAGLIWAAIWLWNVGEEPRFDKFIKAEEAEFIQSSLGVSASGENESPPWKEMLTSKPVWAINIAHFAENWGFYTLLTLLPSYMKDTLETSPLYSGIISSLPYLLMALVVQLAGSIADRIRAFKSTTFVRKLFTCSAFVTQTLFTLVAGQSSDPIVSIVCLTLAVGGGGFAWAGFSVNHLDIGAHWAGILMGISNTFATIPGMVSPLLAGSMTGASTEGWQTVFTVSAVVYLVGAILYGIMASGEEQDWARRQYPMQDDDDDDSD